MDKEDLIEKKLQIAQKRIMDLDKEGEIRRIGSDKTGYWKII